MRAPRGNIPRRMSCHHRTTVHTARDCIRSTPAAAAPAPRPPAAARPPALEPLGRHAVSPPSGRQPHSDPAPWAAPALIPPPARHCRPHWEARATDIPTALAAAQQRGLRLDESAAMAAFPFDLSAFAILNDELAEQGVNPQYAAPAHVAARAPDPVIHVVPATGPSPGVDFDTWWDALESEFTLEKRRYDDLADAILREHGAPTPRQLAPRLLPLLLKWHRLLREQSCMYSLHFELAWLHTVVVELRSSDRAARLPLLRDRKNHVRIRINRSRHWKGDPPPELHHRIPRFAKI